MTNTQGAGVRVHVLDDENGFVETAHEIHRVKGKGLSALTDELPPELLDKLRIAPPPASAAPDPAASRVRRLAVTGPRSLTRQFLAVADHTPGLAAVEVPQSERELEPGLFDLAVIATASLFDPRAARTAARCVRAGRPHLVYGVARDGVTFVGPLWSPQGDGACYECLRVRVASNSVHGQTWRAYMTFLAEGVRPDDGGDSPGDAHPFQHEVPPWAAAQLAGAVGRRAEEWLTAGDDEATGELLWYDESSPAKTRRSLLPVPTCAVCADLHHARAENAAENASDNATASVTANRPRATARPTGTPANGDGGPEALRAAEDDRVGIVHATSVRRAESGPPVYLSGSTSADLSLIKRTMNVTVNGGAGFSKGEAVAATIGESLERYAAGLYRPAELRLASWDELDAAGRSAVPPAEFGLFSPEQYAEPGFPFTPFDGGSRVRWTHATDLLSGAPVRVPASQVYMHYRRVRGEAAIGQSISTGLAAGPTYRAAVLSGLYEVIERDALAISWLHRLPPRPLPPEAVAGSSRVSYLIDRATTWRVRFYDLSLDLTPSTVVAVMEHHSGSEQIMSFGSACRWSPVKAVEKAFLEAAQGLTYVRRLLRQHEDWEAAEDFGNVDDFNKHAILYSKYPELREKAGYLVHPSAPALPGRPERPAPAATDDPVGRITAELAAAGHRVCVVDLTTPDVRRSGAHVVRVLVPGLQHLSGVHGCRMLGNRRLYDVVSALGCDSLPDNPYPHPLP
ncbi:TOMM precursor leader peptide-binding protein [Streptomyces sp. NPDC006645]|uniref:TOMM precursor leader peptide-binding protein n=1 Tax=unclassified Streptomyces TaxID=2593676 RepID=UPI0033ABD7FF